MKSWAKFIPFHSRKCIWKYCPWNSVYFVSASMCKWISLTRICSLFHWFGQSCHFWTLVVQPMTKISRRDNYVADFESRVPMHRIRASGAQTGFIDLSEWYGDRIIAPVMANNVYAIWSVCRSCNSSKFSGICFRNLTSLPEILYQNPDPVTIVSRRLLLM